MRCHHCSSVNRVLDRDLADREFEEAVKAELDLLGWSYTDNTTAHERADLYFTRQVRGRGGAGRAGISARSAVPALGRAKPAFEAELLTPDEVAALLLASWPPRAFVLFHDVPRDRPYVLFTIVDLFCLPVRVQGAINLNSPA